MARKNDWKVGDKAIYMRKMRYMSTTVATPVKVRIVGIVPGTLHPYKVIMPDSEISYCQQRDLCEEGEVTPEMAKEARKLTKKRIKEIQNKLRQEDKADRCEFRILRKEHGLSQEQAAKMLGVSSTRVSSWEREEKPVPADACDRLRQAIENRERETREMSTATEANTKKPDFMEVCDKFSALVKAGLEHKEDKAVAVVIDLAAKQIYQEIKDGVVWNA